MSDVNVTVSDTPITVTPGSGSIGVVIGGSPLTVVIDEDTQTTEISNQPINVEVDNVAQYISQSIIGGGGVSYTAHFGDSTPANICEIADANTTLDEISVTVDEVFNGVGAYITIGTTIDTDLFFTSTDTDLSLLATFEKGFAVDGPFFIVLVIHPGIGASSGILKIQVTTTSK